MEQTAPPQTESIFATDPVGKLILKFSIPCVISLLVSSLYNIVDQIFIGWGVGYLGNGATNVVFPITIIALALALMIGDGCASFLSLRLGEGKQDVARQGVGNAIVMVVVVSILLTVVFQIWIDPILTLFGATDALREYALAYGRIIGLSLPFMMIPAALNSMIRADGSPKYAMLSMILGAAVNTALDPIFIFCFGMGVEGAAIATVIGQAASFVVSFLYLFRFKSVKLHLADLRPDGKVCRTVLSLGISSFITQIAITIVMALSNNLLAHYGAQSIYGSEIPLTAMGIVMKVNQILVSILVGISTGAQPILGYNYGAKNYHRVTRAFDLALIVSEVIAILAFLLFQFSPMTVVSLFGAEDDLYNEFAVQSFRIFLLFCPLTGVQTVAAIYLQAIGKPVKSALLSLSRQIIFFVPVILILTYLLGVMGVLWTGPIADGLAFLLALFMILYERKQLNLASAALAAAPAGEGGQA